MNTSEEQSFVGYFGFGSLVNSNTLRTDYIDHIPARLRGWRRHWQTRSATPEHFAGSNDELVLLSIHQDKDCVLDGAIVIDRAASLPAVDEREAGYSRVKLDKSSLEVLGSYDLPADLYVYVAHVPETVEEGRGALLQSYLDAVMQGYQLSFGDAGVSNFINTTNGFERRIIADRSTPYYPRSVNVSASEASFFDRELVRAGVRFN